MLGLGMIGTEGPKKDMVAGADPNKRLAGCSSFLLLPRLPSDILQWQS